MASANSLVVNLTAKTSQFERGIARARRQLTSFAKFAARTVGNITKSVLTPTGILGALGAGAGGVAMLKMASDAEALQIQLEVLTGSARSASDLLQKMQALAIESPFDRQQLLDGTKTMIAFGVETEKAAQFMDYLSQIAAGDEQRLQSLTLAFSQSAAAGRLMGQDVLQMVNAGFNPMLEISRKTGESMLQLKKRMEAGLIPFSEVSDAFRTATEEGGRFFGMNERMAETTTGKWMKLVEGVKMLARGIGTSLLPFANAMLDSVIPAIQKAGVEMEKFASGFAQMPDKVGTLGKIFESSFDVAIAAIKVKFIELLDWMKKATIEQGTQLALIGSGKLGAPGLRSGGNAGGINRGALGQLLNMQGMMVRQAAGVTGAGGDPTAVAREQLQQAQTAFADLIKGIAAQAPKLPDMADEMPKPEAVAPAITSGLQGMLERVKLKGDEIGWGVRGVLDRAKIRAGAVENMLGNWLGSVPVPGTEDMPQRETRTTGALQRGSAEAYSAIVQAMMGSGDPTVSAIQKMQKAIVDQLKKNAPKGQQIEIAEAVP